MCHKRKIFNFCLCQQKAVKRIIVFLASLRERIDGKNMFFIYVQQTIASLFAISGKIMLIKRN